MPWWLIYSLHVTHWFFTRLESYITCARKFSTKLKFLNITNISCAYQRVRDVFWELLSTQQTDDHLVSRLLHQIFYRKNLLVQNLLFHYEMPQKKKKRKKKKKPSRITVLSKTRNKTSTDFSFSGFWGKQSDSKMFLD